MTNNELTNMASAPEQRLPTELVTLIPSFLVDSSSLRTLAQLNQVSHVVKHETKNQLFQTLVYKCTPSWLHTVGYGIPKGWAHTRNLLLNDTTRALLQHHLGFMVHLKLIDEPRISNVFPKLELLAVTDAAGFTRLTIHKPMSLAGIMERLDTDKHVARSFYGTSWGSKGLPPPPPGAGRARPVANETIVGLDFHDGAYLLPDDGSDETGAGFHALQKFPEFRFQAHGPLPDDWELATFGILQFLDCYRRAQQHYPKAVETMLRLSIPRQWLTLFVGAFEEKQTSVYNVAVNLTTVCTLESFKEDFTTLAELYEDIWHSRRTEGQPLFASMTGMEIIVPASSDASVAAAAAANSHGHAHAHITYMGRLELGHWGEADVGGNATWIDRGFTASLFGITHAHGDAPQPELLSRKAYPCPEAYEPVS